MSVSDRTAAALVVAACLVPLWACGGGKKEDAAGPASAAVPAADLEKPKAPHLYVDYFRLGRALGPDGMATRETNAFKAGEPVAVSLVVWNAPEKAMVRMSVAPIEGGTPAATQEKPLPAKPPLVAFVFDDTSGWKRGTQRLTFEVSDAAHAGWTPLGIKDFRIE